MRATVNKHMVDSRHIPPPTDPPPLDPPPPYQDDPASATTPQPRTGILSNLRTQIGGVLSKLDHVLLHSAVSDLAAANTTKAAPDRVNTVTRRFGQESMAHITRDHLVDILDESLRSAPAKTAAETAGAIATAEAAAISQKASASQIARAKKDAATSAAAPVVVAEMVKLIYSVPENQPWYSLDDGVLVTQTKRGWEMKTSRGEVVQVGQLIYQQLFTKLSCGDQYSEEYRTIMEYVRRGHVNTRNTHTTILVHV